MVSVFDNIRHTSGIMASYVTNSLSLLAFLLSYTSSAEPLHWQLSKGDMTLMVVGSIHMGKPDMYPLPDAITTFLTSSDALITEIDLSDSTMPDLQINPPPILTKEALNDQQLKQLQAINEERGV